VSPGFSGNDRTNLFKCVIEMKQKMHITSQDSILADAQFVGTDSYKELKGLLRSIFAISLLIFK
jgi:hypothetical protein